MERMVALMKNAERAEVRSPSSGLISWADFFDAALAEGCVKEISPNHDPRGNPLRGFLDREIVIFVFRTKSAANHTTAANTTPMTRHQGKESTSDFWHPLR
eukprot:scaffold9436_cov80-Cylindrotheca_fusiformis.AAC.1